MAKSFFIRYGMVITIITVMFVLSTAVILEKDVLRAGQTDQKKEKPIELIKKNIQVLKGISEPEFDNVMDFMAASLGVQCGHCHVTDSTGWHNERDDKPTKLKARQMIQMTMDLNAKSFEGKLEVTCFTCHRGTTDPEKTPPLPQGQAQGPPQFRKEWPPRTPPVLPSEEEVLAMYEKALGGADALKKITTRVSKGVAVDMRGREMPVEVVQQSPDKFAGTVSMKDRGSFTRTFNGTTGWASTNEGSHELESAEIEQLQRNAPLFPITHLREISAKLHLRGKDTVNGAMAYMLVARTGEHTAERYYIDSASGLLLRRVISTETIIGRIPNQVDYSDYRDVSGVKVPFTIKTLMLDPRDNSTRRFSSIDQNVPVDAKKFMMPEMKKEDR